MLRLKLIKLISLIVSLSIFLSAIPSVGSEVIDTTESEVQSGPAVESNITVNSNNTAEEFIRLSVYWAPRAVDGVTTSDECNLDWNATTNGNRMAVRIGNTIDITNSDVVFNDNNYYTTAFSDIMYYVEYGGSSDWIQCTLGEAFYAGEVDKIVFSGVDSKNLKGLIKDRTLGVSYGLSEVVEKLNNCSDRELLQAILNKASAGVSVDDFINGIRRGNDDSGAEWKLYGGYVMVLEGGTYNKINSDVNDTTYAINTYRDAKNYTTLNKNGENWFAVNIAKGIADSDYGYIDATAMDNIEDNVSYSECLIGKSDNTAYHPIQLKDNVVLGNNETGYGTICYYWSGAIPQEDGSGNYGNEGLPVLKMYYDGTNNDNKEIPSNIGPNNKFLGAPKAIIADRAGEVYPAWQTSTIPGEDGYYELRGFAIIDRDTLFMSGDKDNEKWKKDYSSPITGLHPINDNGEEVGLSETALSKLDISNKNKIPFVGLVDDTVRGLLQSNIDASNITNIATLGLLGLSNSDCVERFNKTLTNEDDSSVLKQENGNTGDSLFGDRESGDYEGENKNDNEKEIPYLFDKDSLMYYPGKYNQNLQLVLLYCSPQAGDLPVIEHEAFNFIYVTEYFYNSDYEYMMPYSRFMIETNGVIVTNKKIPKDYTINEWHIDPGVKEKGYTQEVINDIINSNNVTAKKDMYTNCGYNFQKAVFLTDESRGYADIYSDWSDIEVKLQGDNEGKYVVADGWDTSFFESLGILATDTGDENGDVVESVSVPSEMFKLHTEDGTPVYRELFILYYNKKPFEIENLEPSQIVPTYTYTHIGQKKVTQALDDKDIGFKDESFVFKIGTIPDNHCKHAGESEWDKRPTTISDNKLNLMTAQVYDTKIDSDNVDAATFDVYIDSERFAQVYNRPGQVHLKDFDIQNRKQVTLEKDDDAKKIEVSQQNRYIAWRGFDIPTLAYYEYDVKDYNGHSYHDTPADMEWVTGFLEGYEQDAIFEIQANRRSWMDLRTASGEKEYGRSMGINKPTQPGESEEDTKIESPTKEQFISITGVHPDSFGYWDPYGTREYLRMGKVTYDEHYNYFFQLDGSKNGEYVNPTGYDLDEIKSVADYKYTVRCDDCTGKEYTVRLLGEETISSPINHIFTECYNGTATSGDWGQAGQVCVEEDGTKVKYENRAFEYKGVTFHSDGTTKMNTATDRYNISMEYGEAKSDEDNSTEFTIGNKTYTDKQSFVIRDDKKEIVFYPYVEMLYDTQVWKNDKGKLLPLGETDKHGNLINKGSPSETRSYYNSEEGHVEVTKDRPVYVLGGDASVIIPNDYIEVGYRVGGTTDSLLEYKTNTSLFVESQQWSTHKSAMNMLEGTKFEGYKDRAVLPGGTLYRLRTTEGTDGKNTVERTEVALKSYTTIIPTDVSSRGAIWKGGNMFGDKERTASVFALIHQLNRSLNSLDIMQKVTDKNGKNEIELIQSNAESIKGPSGQTLSTDAKYWLKQGEVDGTTESATAVNSTLPNEADLDITDSNIKLTVYRIASDIDGNVVVTKASQEATYVADIVNGMSNTVEGTIPKIKKDTLKILDTTITGNVVASINKTQGLSELLEGSEELRDVDAKTKLFTNYLESIDRNEGWYAPEDENPEDNIEPSIGENTSEHWYNEAFGGIAVAVIEYVAEVGLKDNTKLENLNDNELNKSARTAVIDTRLQPKRDSKSDMYTDYAISWFQTRNKTNAGLSELSGYGVTFNGVTVGIPNWKNEEGYLGSFKLPGDNAEYVDITMKNMNEIYRSKQFVIPDVSVMDLF